MGNFFHPFTISYRKKGNRQSGCDTALTVGSAIEIARKQFLRPDNSFVRADIYRDNTVYIGAVRKDGKFIRS